MQEVGVTRCNMAPEMGKFYRVFEHEGRLICLGEAPCVELGYKPGFHADINEMRWVTEAGERMEMSANEKTEMICEIKKWNKQARREGRMTVRFVDTTKGIYALSDKTRNRLAHVWVLIGLGILGVFWALWVLM